jgi:hypothetical protein
VREASAHGSAVSNLEIADPARALRDGRQSRALQLGSIQELVPGREWAQVELATTNLDAS